MTKGNGKTRQRENYLPMMAAGTLHVHAARFRPLWQWITIFAFNSLLTSKANPTF